MKKRNTLQKQLIIDCLKNTKSHPSVNQLYYMVSKMDNSIGKSTVYRNINYMVKDGTVKTILTDNGIMRYDGDISNHDHFVCNRCGKIIDIDAKFNIINIPLEKQYNFKICNKKVVYEGLCGDCLNNNNI